ncbi:hypothetical protein P154DRAFT_534802 [Amniculicola lignicola CBS 123094]|uniref:BTB domain-containing protein n=1 Tax=Amniculicola lignicola CBS 123094 TaxID=1392246 RepID=A0A6A5WF01_9PLEO|nr:hypothetical protein P154DRAFT_534802 [Amniculicola lignicola CBS 123094]
MPTQCQDMKSPMPASVEYLSGPVIKVLVGEDQTPIHVHKSVLGSSSRFLQKVTSEEWSELREDANTIHLLDSDAESFKMYSHWLYTRTITLANRARETYKQLAQAYVLGELLLDLWFKNFVLDTIVASTAEGRFKSMTRAFPRAEPTIIIYNGTTSSSPARRLLTDFFVYCVTNTSTRLGNLITLPKEFLADALEKMSTMREVPNVSGRPWDITMELYHEKVDFGLGENPDTNHKQ